MPKHHATILSVSTLAALAAGLSGCQSTDQHTWLVSGSNPVMLSAMEAPATADAPITGSSGSSGYAGGVTFGAGDALGYQLYMNYVHYVHATGDTGTMYATGVSPRPTSD